MSPSLYSNLLQFSGSFHLHLNPWIAFTNVLDFLQNGKNEEDGQEVAENAWLLQYFPGFSFQLRRWRVDHGIIIPLNGIIIPLKGNNVPADPGYHVTLHYTF